MSASLESGSGRLNRTGSDCSTMQCTDPLTVLFCTALYYLQLTLDGPVRYLGKEATVTSTLWPFDLCDHCYLPAQARTEWELRWASILCCTIQQICYSFCQEEKKILKGLITPRSYGLFSSENHVIDIIKIFSQSVYIYFFFEWNWRILLWF